MVRIHSPDPNALSGIYSQNSITNQINKLNNNIDQPMAGGKNKNMTEAQEKTVHYR